MKLGEIISYGIYIGGALGIAVVAILAFGLFLQMERSIGKLIVPVFVPLIALGITVGSLLSMRNLTYASFSIDSINAGTGAPVGGSVLRLISFTIVGLCGAKIVGYMLDRNRQTPENGKLLFMAFVVYFIGNTVLNSAFGAHPDFIHNIFYAIFVFTAVYLARHESLDDTVRFAKVALLCMMLLSLVVAVVKPQLALQPNYKGWVPGLSVRLWGVGSNPNSIAPLALLLLLVESMLPTKRFWLRWLTILSALVVFLLAQSKTVWAAGIVAFAVVFWHRNYRLLNGRLAPGVLVAILAGLSLTTISLFFVDSDALWHKIAVTQAGSDISTLTGRAQIWSAAIDMWKDNPLFGYGPTAWDPAHRRAIGIPFAFSAHNQFLHSMSAAGTIGGVTLLSYLFVLGFCAYRSATATRGISLALFATILFRCMSETPLESETILNGDFLTHLVLFLMALRSQGAAHSSARPLTEASRSNGSDALNARFN
jgi:O-antigen ligase